jgi:hypothetical protein
MSTPTIINIESKRKPSRALIMRTIGVYLEQGHQDLDIRWGEWWLEIVRGGNKWFGAGWIKDISGDDIANELNQMEKQAIINEYRSFMKDHVSIVVIK